MAEPWRFTGVRLHHDPGRGILVRVTSRDAEDRGGASRRKEGVDQVVDLLCGFEIKKP